MWVLLRPHTRLAVAVPRRHHCHLAVQPQFILFCKSIFSLKQRRAASRPLVARKAVILDCPPATHFGPHTHTQTRTPNSSRECNPACTVVAHSPDFSDDPPGKSRRLYFICRAHTCHSAMFPSFFSSSLAVCRLSTIGVISGTCTFIFTLGWFFIPSFAGGRARSVESFSPFSSSLTFLTSHKSVRREAVHHQRIIKICLRDTIMFHYVPSCGWKLARRKKKRKSVANCTNKCHIIT